MGNVESFNAGIIVNPLDNIKSYSPTTQCNKLNDKDTKYIKNAFKSCIDDDRNMGKGVSKSDKLRSCCEQTDCSNPETVIKECKKIENYRKNVSYTGMEGVM